MFLKNSQNSQESTCARVSFFNKVAGLGPGNFKNTSFNRTHPGDCFCLKVD